MDTYGAQANTDSIVGTDHVALDAEIVESLAHVEIDHLEVQILHGIRKIALWRSGNGSPRRYDGVIVWHWAGSGKRDRLL